MHFHKAFRTYNLKLQEASSSICCKCPVTATLSSSVSTCKVMSSELLLVSDDVKSSGSTLDPSGGIPSLTSGSYRNNS